MNLMDIVSDRSRPGPLFESVVRRVVCVALLLLPGGVIALPLLWWLERQRMRDDPLQPNDGSDRKNFQVRIRDRVKVQP